MESESAHLRAGPKAKRIARRALELIAAAGFVVVAPYWPTTNEGRVVLIGALLLFFIGLKFLSKWQSV